MPKKLPVAGALPRTQLSPRLSSWWEGARCCPPLQGDHSPDNVKFPDISRHSSATLGMLSVTHIMSVLVLLSVVGVGMQQCMIRNHIFNI